ncbi:hypothetical protein SAMN02745704_02105 [Paucidesulfovibrio gracilis DSM 16080]|uniref:Uncharacterized protein n=1 Tax=Paucidesulfovibrio gracilis DSM 16080 TaxID=1121449 RepID=A0A1T4XFZ8_9BACT|nr:hypothetical protein [Paucidesulfovibrio gracilis]SKA88317.1 hypothetical protein SAMN02745704_02105 [Paucidesulfovibrio gracilis DSM 16080]
MNSLRDRLQHALNPLHLFCRLRRFGIRCGPARRLCSAWERHVYRFLLSR